MIGLGADLVLNRAQARNIAEQLLDGVAQLQPGQRADLDSQLARALGRLGTDHRTWLCNLGGCGGRCWSRRIRRHRGNSGSRLHRPGSSRAAIDLGDFGQALGQGLDTHHQFRSRNRLALVAGLVTCQQAAAGVRRLQQHIDHLGDRRDFVAAQAVQQGLHAVRELGHIREAEGRRTALDGVGAAENTVELFIVGGRKVQAEQHLLHLVEVLAGFLEKDLIELAKVEVCARTCAILVCIRHGVSCCDSLLSA
ncbi:hypothetical protein SDC9_166658 [bioreactor metagenome]|uniref:Uncharacterized protein n=1 Tax=bioreactor metagenome TaxID=1076179 RepID=A0A645FXK2_9ZZZZ